MQARDWLDRHRRMVAWNNAVIINTAAGYRAFLAKFPDSDLAATARKLEERLRNRPEYRCRLVAGAGASAAKRRADLSLQRAGAAPPQLKKSRCAGQARRSGSAQARRSRRRSGCACADDDVVVVRRPPPREVYEPRPDLRSASGSASVDRRRWLWRRQLRRRSGPGAGVDTEAGNRVIDFASERRAAACPAEISCEAWSACSPCSCSFAAPALAWEHWGGDRGGMRFSPLAQITPGNVGSLVRAWEFRTGDLDSRAPELMARTKFRRRRCLSRTA